MSGDASFRGAVAFQQRGRAYSASASGDALLAGVKLLSVPEPGSLASADALMNWQALSLRGFKITIAPATKPTLEVAAVRDALIARGLPSERLFLAAPKLRASGEEDAAWTPRVRLSLSPN